MDLRRLIVLARMKLAEDLNPFLLCVAFVASLVPAGMALVMVHEVRTVAIHHGELLPELAPALRKSGFDVRTARPGEGTDTRSGIVALRVEADGPVTRTIWIENSWDELRTTMGSSLRAYQAKAEAKRLYRRRLLREAGLPEEVDAPIRVGPMTPGGHDAEALDGGEPRGPGLVATLFGIAPARAVSMALGLATAAVLATCGLPLSLARYSGRLEILFASGVTPAEHVAACALLAAGSAFVLAAGAVAAVTAGIAWFGMAPHWPGLWLVALAPAFALALAGWPIAAMAAVRRHLWSDLAAAGAIAAVAGLAVLPRVAGLAGFPEVADAAPFHGIAVGLVSGEVGPRAAAISGGLTAGLALVGFLLARRALDARFYLRQDL